MNAWLEVGLSNALLATVLAVAAWLVTRVVRRADVAFVVWVLVLAKLVSPPLVSVPWQFAWTSETDVDADDRMDDSAASVAIRSDVPNIHDGEPGGVVVAWPASTAQAVTVPSTSFSAKPSAVPGTPLPVSQVAAKTIDGPSPLDVAAAAIVQLAPLAGWVWLAGSGCWFAVAVIRVVRFTRLLRRAEPAPGQWQAEVDALVRRLGLRRAVRVRLVRRQVPPLVWAMTGKATMLLPAAFMRTLSADERSTLFVHELAHLERRAFLVRWLELAALGLYWWHPVAWWARRKIEQAEEHCCDARVVALLPDLARCYAKTLLATVDFLSDARPALPLGASGFSQKRHVKRRLEMILTTTVTRRTSWPLRLALLTTGLAVLPLSIPMLKAEPSSPKSETAADDGAGPTEKTDASGPANSVEQRLDRLEKMIQSLVDEKQAKASASSQTRSNVPPAPWPSPAQPAKEETGAVEGWPPDNMQREVEKMFSDLAKNVRHKLELSETNFHRCIAAARQVGAVSAAYEAETVTLDQLLEAHRRLTDARVSYARTASDLMSEPAEREFLLARAKLAAGNQALKDTQELWKKVHQRSGAESEDEAQAREQYFSFKAQWQQLHNEYVRAEERLKATQSKSAPVRR